MHQYATGRIMSLRRRCDKLTSVDVTFASEKCSDKADREKVCVKILLARKTIHLSSVAEDMYAAIDNLRDKVAAEIARYKEMHTGHRRHGSPKHGTATVVHLRS
jgi:putative sigma-54 modulation protein